MQLQTSQDGRCVLQYSRCRVKSGYMVPIESIDQPTHGRSRSKTKTATVGDVGQAECTQGGRCDVGVLGLVDELKH